MRSQHSKEILYCQGVKHIFDSTGVGYATVKALARRGAKVYMAARNESKATGAMASLEHEGVAPGTVAWLKLDLLDLRGVKKAAEEFLSKELRLDLLGMLASPERPR